MYNPENRFPEGNIRNSTKSTAYVTNTESDFVVALPVVTGP